MGIHDNCLKINFASRKKEELIKLSELENEKVIFSFNEHEEISLSKTKGDYKIIIECATYAIKKDYFDVDDNLLEIEEGKKYIISNKNFINVSYLPGLYNIYIYYQNRKICCHFRVETNAEVSNLGMKDLITNLDLFVPGLSLDFYRQNSLVNNNSDFLNSAYILEYLTVNKNKLVLELDYLLKNSKNNIVNQYMLEANLGKQNYRSIYLNLVKNHSINKFINVKKTESTNNLESRDLKYLLIQIQKELDKVYSDFKQVYFKKNNLKKEINSFLDSNNIYYSNLKKREATNKKLSEQKRQNELNVAINKYENWLEAIVTIRNKINALIHSNYFSELGVTSAIRETIGFSKNPHHQYFLRLYLFLLNKSNFNYSLFSNKPSYLLFELYGFVIIDNILKMKGFTLINDTELKTNNFIANLTLFYIKDNIKISITYDYFCNSYQEKENNKVVNINSSHSKPDYIINIYRNDKILGIIILEAKYRRLTNMVSDNYDVITEILDDYSQLAFRDSNGLLIRDVIKKVIVIYPDKNENITSKGINGLLLGINLELDLLASKALERIENEICSIIEKNNT